MATAGLVAIWLCSSLSLLIMVSRLVLGRFFGQKFDVGDGLTVTAIFFTLVRTPLAHVVIVWGTNNLSAAYRETHQFGSLEIYHREIGSKFTLVARTLYIIL